MDSGSVRVKEIGSEIKKGLMTGWHLDFQKLRVTMTDSVKGLARVIKKVKY